MSEPARPPAISPARAHAATISTCITRFLLVGPPAHRLLRRVRLAVHYTICYIKYMNNKFYIQRSAKEPVARRNRGSGRQNGEVAMFENKTSVLLVVPQEIVDRARVFAGAATTRLKRPVSLQMVLRALIDEGLRRAGDRAVLANVEAQLQAIRRIRSGLARAGKGRRRRLVDAARRVGRRPSQARRS